MDTEELDQWLEADGRDGAGGRTEGWAGRPHEVPPARTGRPRWLWPAVGGAVLWAGVTAVVLTGTPDDASPPPADPAASDLMALAQPVTEGAQDDGSAAVPEASPVDEQAAGATSGATTDPGGGDLMAGPTEAPVGAPAADAAGSEPVGPLHAAAVSALRGVLTASTAERDSYLELATPVEVLPLAEGAVVVLVDAVWLEGSDGHLSEVHHGRWAVPLAADATLLGTPWPTGAATAGAAVPEEPPVGTLRLDDVEAAMTAAGWSSVQAVAAEDHPFIPGILVALVHATPPEGRPREGDVVWLQEDGSTDLELLGAER